MIGPRGPRPSHLGDDEIVHLLVGFSACAARSRGLVTDAVAPELPTLAESGPHVTMKTLDSLVDLLLGISALADAVDRVVDAIAPAPGSPGDDSPAPPAAVSLRELLR